MDASRVGIAAGILAAIAYAAVKGIRQRTFDTGNTVLVFLAVFTVPSCANLLRAALIGKPECLPPNWREYLAVAGVVCAGLSIHYLFRAGSSAWTRRAKRKDTKTDIAQHSPSDSESHDGLR
jgi:drug/metabolite transporter (DMT)-like permease